MQWDDLRYVLAVYRNHSLAAAARALGVSHVTVARRIEALEKALGVRLFDRKRDGHQATDIGAEVVRQAEQVEAEVNALERRAWREDEQVRGMVRLTVTDTIGDTVLPPMLGALREAHPDLVLEVTVSDQTVSLTRHDADIAIRYTTAPPEMLIGHLLAPVAYAVYGPARLAPRGRRKAPDLRGLPWVAPDDGPVERRFHAWLRRHGYASRVVLRCNSYVALAAAVRAGVGVGVLSCFSAESLGGLARLSPVIAELEYQYWILTHPELRHVARVGTVYAYLRRAFADLHPLFAGGEPCKPPS